MMTLLSHHTKDMLGLDTDIVVHKIPIETKCTHIKADPPTYETTHNSYNQRRG